MVAEKLPPHDIEAEEAVVASLLVDPEAIYKVASILRPNHFFREKNRWIFEACYDLWQHNENINQITVAHELARHGRLEEIGGSAYLSQLVGDLPTPLVAESSARLVQRDGIYRDLIQAAQQIAQMAFKGDDPEVSRVLAQAESLIAPVRQGEAGRDFI
ncbi:MAG: DnaB-like helicase N-terminal domain-containing protein, partial [Dehalococcoidia bacterium]